jgi:hypothetical protein
MLQRSFTGFLGFAALIVVLLAVPSAASAANSCDVGTVDKTWVGNTSSDWFTASNWSPSGVPGTGSDVCIPASNPSVNPVPAIATGATANAASIESFKPINVDAGTLRANSAPQASAFHDDLNLAAGTTLDNRGSLTVEGDLSWSAATITSGGAVGTVTIASGGTTTATTVNTQRILNHQTLRINGAGTFAGNDPDVFNDDTYLQNAGTLEIGSGGTLDLQGDQDIIDNGGTGTNSVHVLSGGTLSRSTGTTTSFISAQLDNDGIVSATAASTTASPALSFIGGSGTAISGGQFAPAPVAVIDLGAGTHKIDGASFAGGGTTQVSSGTLDATGTNTVASGATLALTNSTLANAGTATVNGTLQWGNASTISGVGTTTIASGAALNNAGGNSNFLQDGTLRINGTGTLTGGTDDTNDGWDTWLSNGALLEVGSGGTLDLRHAWDVHWNFGAEPRFHVASGGTLSRSVGSGPDAGTAPFDNDGTVSIQAGSYSLQGGSPTVGTVPDQTSTGQFNASTGATLDFGNGTHKLANPAAFGGGGTVAVSAGTVQTTGAVSSGASTTLSLSQSTLSNAGTMTVNGTLVWGENSTIAGVGTTVIGVGGALNNGGADQHFLQDGTLRINGTGTLTGDQDDPGLGDDTWLSNDATLEVGPTGTLDLQHAQDIYWNFGAEPQMHVFAGGTVTKTAGSGLDRINVAFTNDGTVDVSSGQLAIEGTFANYNQTTDLLSGGIYAVRNGSTLQFTGADVKNNGAELILDGAGSQIQDEGALDGLRDYASNNASGTLRLRNGRNFGRTGGFTNNGLIDLAPTTKFTTTGIYNQSSTGTLATEIAGTVAGTSYGQLAAGAAANLAGVLTVTMSYIPQTGDVFDVVTGASRTGTFATVNGQGFDVKYLADRVRLTPPSLVIANRTQPEGNAGSTNARFKVTLSSPSAGTVTADYDTADGSATAPADYTSTSGTVTLTPGQTSKFIDVPVNGDTLDEINEKFNVVLSNPALAEIADDTGVGTITDDDPPPVVSIGDTSHSEGGSLVFTVSLSAPSAKQVKIGYATAPGTATAPADYTSKSGTVTFAPGQTSKTVSVSSAQDTTDEDDETFSVNLSSPVNTSIGDGTGTGTILDNDAPPALTINDASRTEGSAVNGFAIGLSAASGKTVTVTYSTIDGTAKAPGDYTAKTATVSFTPGQTSKQVTINTVQDTLDENDETFTVKLTSPQNATISDSTGLGTILDNDPPPGISIDDVSHAEGGQYVFTVTLSAASSKQVKVDYGTADGSATAPSDYTTKAGTLTFAPGDTTKTISVSSIGDHAVEPDETFTVNLTNGVNGGITDASGTGTLVNND